MTIPSWDEFSDMLFKLSKKEGQKGGYNSSPLISPAIYEEQSTRSNRNVTHWGSWCAVDVDTMDVDYNSLHGSLSAICGEYRYVCYSTASSKEDKPKFRLVFPLTREVDIKEIPHFWYALNQRLHAIGDKQTKDVSRMYYIPANYPEAFNFFFVNDGIDIDPTDMMNAYAYQEKNSGSFLDRLPEALRDQVVQYRKEQLTNTSVNWTSYKDCPYFPKRLAAEYTIAGAGWYGKMFQIMVALAGNAVKDNYPITAKQIADMCRELDKDTGNWYNNRPFELEADSALEYIYKN
jgi:hypothetical protein